MTNMNALTSGTGGADRTQLVDQLARRVDANHDGQVTSEEFASFLNGLMQSLDEETASQRTLASPVQRAAGGDVTPALLSETDGAPMSRAQGAALLRQAFETLTRTR